MDSVSTHEFDSALEAVKNSARTEKGQGIGYEPDLIEVLTDEHRQLNELMTSLEDLIKQEDCHKIASEIAAFKPILAKHLINESVKIYTFLTRKLDPHSKEFANLNKVRNDMFRIGDCAFKFFSAFSDPRAVELKWGEYKVEFSMVRDMLTTRLTLEEEKLFIIYKQLGG